MNKTLAMSPPAILVFPDLIPIRPLPGNLVGEALSKTFP
jgi:hypothetical protein